MNKTMKEQMLRNFFGPNLISQPVIRGGDDHCRLKPDFIFPAGLMVEDKHFQGETREGFWAAVGRSRQGLTAYMAEGLWRQPELFSGSWVGVGWVLSDQSNFFTFRSYRDGVPASGWRIGSPADVLAIVPGDLTTPIGPEWDPVRPNSYHFGWCPGCQRMLPRSAFARCSTNRFDRQGKCRKCRSAMDKERRTTSEFYEAENLRSRERYANDPEYREAKLARNREYYHRRKAAA